jgi:hypothetical protein
MLPFRSISSRWPLLVAVVTGSFLSLPGLAGELVNLHGRWVTPAEAAAYVAPAAATSTPKWGTTSTSNLTIGPCDAGSPRDQVQTYYTSNCEMLIPLEALTGNAGVGFPVHLPTGALITSVTVNYFDSEGASVDPGFGLFASTPDGILVPVLNFLAPDFSGGVNSFEATPAAPIAVDNTNAYQILAIIHRTDLTQFQGLISFQIHYMLQVSPAPLTATFGDVATDHPFFQYIEALAASGITGGCGGGNYCPDQALTRGQMAVFLAKALGLHFPN